MSYETHFEQILELPEGERAFLLDHQCLDPVLRQWLEALLIADAENHSALKIVESWMQARLFRSVRNSHDEPISPPALLKMIIEETLGQFRDSPVYTLTSEKNETRGRNRFQ